jgi:hypothetical protein
LTVFERTKVACNICHDRKSKCDGDEPCGSCRKRGFECQYTIHHASSTANPKAYSAEDEASDTEMAALSSLDPIQTLIPKEASAMDKSPKFPYTFRSTSSSMIDWARTVIRADSGDQSKDDIWLDPEGYLDIYYEYFHHRWPIIHRQSLKDEDDPHIVVTAMKMIGAWIEGRLSARNYAEKVHGDMLETLTYRLVCLTTRLFLIFKIKLMEAISWLSSISTHHSGSLGPYCLA